jgi:thioredoxin 1
MEITSKDLKEKLNNGEKVVVEFWASWCGPCRMLKPVFEKVISENQTKVQMYTMNIDDSENKEIALKYGIRSIPAIKTFEGTNLKETSVGVVSENKIKELVNNLL